MRVLLIPEVYRRDDLSSNGTVSDTRMWVEQWLETDNRLHVYWLLPPRGAVNYDAEDVFADRERVTLIEAEPFDAGGDPSMFTEGGYSAAQLTALKRTIFDSLGYVDAVVDQLRTGRTTLYKWLLQHTDQWAARVRPFDVIADIHDLQVPFKYRYCSYRNEFQMRMEMCAAAFADGIWFTAGVDADGMRRHAPAFLRPSVVEDAMDRALVTGSPLDLSRFEETYRDEPRRFHAAGSFWAKKHAGAVLDAAERLHERFGIRTVVTSMEDVPAAIQNRKWIEAYPNASRETYERALQRGDIAVCASEYETMARTPFEQAASGQVLVLRDEPWIYDCVPEDYPLAIPADDLVDTLAWVVEHWDTAVEANRRLVAHVQRVRDPERCGRRTYDDLRRRVETRVRDCGTRPEDDVVRAALAGMDERVALDNLNEWTARHTEDGSPVLDSSHTLTDLVYALRTMGYADTGNPGTPVFRAPG